MLTRSQETVLLNAVPSVERRWVEWERGQAEYESMYPDEALSPKERTHEFLFRLSHHLGANVARGDLREAEWLFAAMEPVYEEADEDLENALTIGFLEGLIYSIEGAGVDASVLEPLSKGERTTDSWRAAYRYIHPRRAAELWGA